MRASAAPGAGSERLDRFFLPGGCGQDAFGPRSSSLFPAIAGLRRHVGKIGVAQNHGRSTPCIEECLGSTALARPIASARVFLHQIIGHIGAPHSPRAKSAKVRGTTCKSRLKSAFSAGCAGTGGCERVCSHYRSARARHDTDHPATARGCRSAFRRRLGSIWSSGRANPCSCRAGLPRPPERHHFACFRAHRGPFPRSVARRGPSLRGRAEACFRSGLPIEYRVGHRLDSAAP